MFTPVYIATIAQCLDGVLMLMMYPYHFCPSPPSPVWLIYKKVRAAKCSFREPLTNNPPLRPSQIQAEEKFGLQGFRYLGGGKYEAAPGAVINQQPPSYGAVN